jgi:hypothetical protein
MRAAAALRGGVATMHDLAFSVLSGRGALLPLAAFIAVGVMVFLVASRLARHADAVADATGLGRLWVGTVLLAASTSLPELTTDVNAAILNTVDIGVGDLMGSTLANMLLLGLLDLVYRRRQLLDNVSPNHALVATLASPHGHGGRRHRLRWVGSNRARRRRDNPDRRYLPRWHEIRVRQHEPYRTTRTTRTR